MKLFRTATNHPDFVALIALLDAELNARYGRIQATYDPLNQMDVLHTAVVAYISNQAVACGCFKEMSDTAVEIKRMFVRATERKQGLATAVLQDLESWATELGYGTAFLETGKSQPEAITLYQKHGYQLTHNYGPYIGRINSVCMKKDL